MKRQSHLISAILFGVTILVTAAVTKTTAKENDIDARIFKSKTGGTIPYRILKPANYNPKQRYPIVLCLHGAGGRGKDNKSRGTEAFKVLSSPDVQKEYPSFLVTPQCPEGANWGSAATNSTVRYIDLVLEFIEDIQKEFSIDPSRVYVSGQSMGGYGTWMILTIKPNLFAAAVPVCGGGNPSAAKEIAHVPIWVFHGGIDAVVPTQKSRDMVAALKKEDSKVIYTEYTNVGHNSWIPAWKEKGLIPWLFKQHNKPDAGGGK